MRDRKRCARTGVPYWFFSPSRCWLALHQSIQCTITLTFVVCTCIFNLVQRCDAVSALKVYVCLHACIVTNDNLHFYISTKTMNSNIHKRSSSLSIPLTAFAVAQKAGTSSSHQVSWFQVLETSWSFKSFFVWN